MLVRWVYLWSGVITVSIFALLSSFSLAAKTTSVAPKLTFHSISQLGCGSDDFDAGELQKITQQADPHALYELALYYYKQRTHCGSAKEYHALLQQVTQWLNFAADQDDLLAQRYLASIYIDELGELEKGIYWLKKASAQHSPEAKFILSTAYNYGEGVEQDRAKGLTLLKQSAELGYSPAQFELALFYQHGDNHTAPNLPQAAYWYQQAAEHGLNAAQFNLGIFYQDGLGVTQDITQAIYWFEQAAQQNNSDAQNNLGAIYENAKGVEQNLSLAESWYKKAAEQGDAIAQSNLGVFYLNHHLDLKITNGLLLAYAWLGSAIYAGNTQAIPAKQLAFKQLTLKQLAEAQQLMDQYIQQYGEHNVQNN